ncbi:unnamed protein product [Penicillium palitans]
MAVKDLLWANSEVVITNTAAAPALQRPGAARTPASRRNGTITIYVVSERLCPDGASGAYLE